MIDPKQAITNLLGTCAIQSGFCGGKVFMNLQKKKKEGYEEGGGGGGG